jgi:hypothetical protein
LTPILQATLDPWHLPLAPLLDSRVYNAGDLLVPLRGAA